MMEKATINGVDLAYEVAGEGEPVLLIHGAFVADAMRPLAEELDGFRTIVYHRRGYGESGGEPPADVATHAADAAALLEHLDAAPAHVIGHSYGGTTALQLAAEAPGSVKSLSLLEAAVAAQIPSAAVVGETLGQVIAPFFVGEAENAVDRFLHMVFGKDWKEATSRALSPAAITQANADADDAFAGDITTLGGWTFGPEEAARIKCPVLLILGETSDATVRTALGELGIELPDPDLDVFGEMMATQQSWLPQAEFQTLAGINHALQVQDPAAVADVVTTFLAKNRVPA